MSVPRVFLILSAFFVLFIFSDLPVVSQSTEVVLNDSSLGVASFYPISENVVEGDIIISQNNTYVKSQKEYQENIFGVVTLKPAVSIDPQIENTYPIIRDGEILVNVSNINGEIMPGDYITTSNIAGVGMKMKKDSFAVGIARQSLTETDEKGIGKIIVEVRPRFLYINSEVSKDKTFIKPIFERASGGNTSYSLPRYLLGGLIALAALVFLVLNIKKIAQQGLASIGRNPLASKMIIFSVIINLTITSVVTLLGIGLAYLVFAL